MTIITAIISGIAGLFLGYHWGRRKGEADGYGRGRAEGYLEGHVAGAAQNRSVSPQAGGGPGVPE